MAKDDTLTEIVVRSINSDLHSEVRLSFIFNDDWTSKSYHIRIKNKAPRCDVVRQLMSSTDIIAHPRKLIPKAKWSRYRLYFQSHTVDVKAPDEYTAVIEAASGVPYRVVEIPND